jgi:hypothetical protein
MHSGGAWGVLLTTVLAACGGTTRHPPDDQERTLAWPQQVVLHTQSYEGESLRLVDAQVVSEGDLVLNQSRLISLAAKAESFCEKGTFEILADVPTDDACVGGVWISRLPLTPTFTHGNEESSYIGLGALVKDATQTTTYRLRVLGDSYGGGDATVTFEYEPLP